MVGWDIEIAGEFPPGNDHNWLTVEPPMEISCAAIHDATAGMAFGPAGYQNPLDPQGAKMSVTQARAMAEHLYEHQARAGNRIVTWNGLSFDFPVLARACNDAVYTQMLAELALDHCDLGFAMFCSHGYMVGMQTAAQALGLHGKTEGMSGALAPILWNRPERELTDLEAQEIGALGVKPGSAEARELCIEYVIQDALTTVEIYHALKRGGVLIWKTKAGPITKNPWKPYIVGGEIATCRQALEIDPPNVSWMRAPRARKDYIGWATKTLGE